MAIVSITIEVGQFAGADPLVDAIFAYPRTEAGGAGVLDSSSFTVVPENPNRYIITLSYDDAVSSNKIVGDWVVGVGTATNRFAESSVRFQDGQTHYSMGVASTGGATLAKQEEILSKFAGHIVLSEPVVFDGQITSPIVIGDDYFAAHDRAFVWVVGKVPTVVTGTSTCWFGVSHPEFGSFLVEGVLSDTLDGDWKLTFDLNRSDTEQLCEGRYRWSVAVHDVNGKEITRARSKNKHYEVDLVAKQT